MSRPDPLFSAAGVPALAGLSPAHPGAQAPVPRSVINPVNLPYSLVVDACNDSGSTRGAVVTSAP